MRQIAPGFSIWEVCQALSVSRSAYYAYLQGKTHHHRGAKADIADRVEEVFVEHRRRYGSRRIQAELKDSGHVAGRYQVRKRMQEKGLKAIQPRSFVPKTTQNNPALQRSPNLLLDFGVVHAPNNVWVGDITYLPLAEGSWLYLAVWMDLFSRLIVGWQLGQTLQAFIVVRSFQQALDRRRPPSGLLVHSDGGKQYQAQAFRNLLQRHGCRQSMTRVDNHYDNASIESLFSRFKAELLGPKAFDNYQQAHEAIFEYIEVYYNRKRRHSSLNYMAPNTFEINHVKEQ